MSRVISAAAFSDRDITDANTPKNAGIDKIVSSAPAKVVAGWPAPMINHSAAFRVGYYTKDGLPPDSVVSYLPENSTSEYLIRFDSPCESGIKVTLCKCCRAVLLTQVQQPRLRMYHMLGFTSALLL